MEDVDDGSGGVEEEEKRKVLRVQAKQNARDWTSGLRKGTGRASEGQLRKMVLLVGGVIGGVTAAWALWLAGGGLITPPGLCSKPDCPSIDPQHLSREGQVRVG